MLYTCLIIQCKRGIGGSVKSKTLFAHISTLCRTLGLLCQFVLIKTCYIKLIRLSDPHTDMQYMHKHTQIHSTAVILGSTDDGLVGGKSTSILFQLKDSSQCLQTRPKCAEVGQFWDQSPSSIFYQKGGYFGLDSHVKDVRNGPNMD